MLAQVSVIGDHIIPRYCKQKNIASFPDASYVLTKII